MASAQFSVPEVKNEPMRDYAPGTRDREALYAAIANLKSKLPVQVPLVIGGKEVTQANTWPSKLTNRYEAL